MHLKLLLFCLIFAATPVWAGNRHHPDKVDRIIVKYKQAENQSGQTIQRDTTIPHAKGVLRLSRLRTGNYADIYNLDKTLTAA